MTLPPFLRCSVCPWIEQERPLDAEIKTASGGRSVYFAQVLAGFRDSYWQNRAQSSLRGNRFRKFWGPSRVKTVSTASPRSGCVRPAVQ